VASYSELWAAKTSAKLGACNNRLPACMTGKEMNSSGRYARSLVSSRTIVLQFKSTCVVLGVDGRESDRLGIRDAGRASRERRETPHTPETRLKLYALSILISRHYSTSQQHPCSCTAGHVAVHHDSPSARSTISAWRSSRRTADSAARPSYAHKSAETHAVCAGCRCCKSSSNHACCVYMRPDNRSPPSFCRLRCVKELISSTLSTYGTGPIDKWLAVSRQSTKAPRT
jgi:hypothetical protein